MLTRFRSAINFLFHHLLYTFFEKNKDINCIIPLNINYLIQIAFNYLTNLFNKFSPKITNIKSNILKTDKNQKLLTFLF